MKPISPEHLQSLLHHGVWLLLGAVLGVSLTLHSTNSALVVYYGNGQPVLVLGTDPLELIGSLDHLDSEAREELIAKVKDIPPSSLIGQDIQKLATRLQGPFQPLQTQVTVHLVDNNQDIKDDVAASCAGAEIFQQKLMVFDRLSLESGPNGHMKGAFSVYAIHQNENCQESDKKINAVWVDKQHFLQSVDNSHEFAGSVFKMKAMVLLPDVQIEPDVGV